MSTPRPVIFTLTLILCRHCCPAFAVLLPLFPLIFLSCYFCKIRAQHVIAADIDALEERMWHDVNEYQLSLQQHISDRDALLNKIYRASQQLLLLKVRRCSLVLVEPMWGWSLRGLT